MLDSRRIDSRPPQVRQFRRPPSVYLDHWAFRRFSEKPELRDALASAITDRDGTLAIGRLNLLEFTRVQDAQQLQAAEELVQAVLPRVFFLDIQIMDVVNRETAGEIGACGDMDMLRQFGQHLMDDAQGWRAIHLFEVLSANRHEYQARFAEIERKVLAGLREYEELDRETVRTGLKEARGRPLATLGLARALVDQIFRDKRRPLDQGDASDMMHSVVPCAYCDFVLIDSEWRDYVDRARKHLSPDQHVARVYSQNELAQFMATLRAHPKDPRSAPPWPD